MQVMQGTMKLFPILTPPHGTVIPVCYTTECRTVTVLATQRRIRTRKRVVLLSMLLLVVFMTSQH